MNRHELKCEPGHFRDVQLGLKKYEVRYNDRGFSVGDEIELVEYHVHFGELGGRLTAKITHILHGGYGLKPGYAVLGIELVGYADEEMRSFVYFGLLPIQYKAGDQVALPGAGQADTLKPGSIFRLFDGDWQAGRTGLEAAQGVFIGPHLICEKLPPGPYDFKVIEVCDGS